MEEVCFVLMLFSRCYLLNESLFCSFFVFFCFFTGFSACEQDENLKQFTSEKKKKKRIKRSEKKKTDEQILEQSRKKMGSQHRA